MTRRLRFSVRTKILSGSVLVFVLFITVLIYNLVQMRRIAWQLTIVQQGYLPLTQVVARMDNDHQSMERYLNPDRLLSRENVPTNLYLSLALFHLSRVGESIRNGKERVEATLKLPGVESEQRALNIIRDQLLTIEREYDAYSQALRDVMARLQAGQMEAARALVPSLRSHMDKVSRAIRDLDDLLAQRVESAVQTTRERQAQAAYMAGGLSAAAIVFGMVAIFATHLVLRPISRLIQGVKSIAGGDYGQRVSIEADDEIGTLAREFNAMAGSLEEREASLRKSQAELEAALENQKRVHQELKRISHYNESIIQSIDVGLIVCDREGRVTTLNQAAERIWGIESSSAVGRRLGEVLPIGGLEAWSAQVQESGDVLRKDGLELRTGDGPERLIDTTFVPLMGDGGAVEGVIVVAEDVTEKTRTKERLIQTERLALIGRMSAQVTHEIRNPLNALGLNAEMLEDEIVALDPDGRTDAHGLLRSISSEIDRLTEVTETYLRLARQPSPQLERVDIGPVVANLLEFMQEELSADGIEVTLDLAQRLPEAMVDENQLRQALLNILRNSREATRHGGRIHVRVGKAERDIEIVIQDEGEGMEPDVLAHIFDPFYSTKSTGTGLGLPISQQIIEEHGGRIMVKSAPGAGTTFRILLPPA